MQEEGAVRSDRVSGSRKHTQKTELQCSDGVFGIREVRVTFYEDL